MNLFIKRGLILASVACISQFLSSAPALAQTEATPDTTEEVVAATDTLQEEMQALSDGKDYVPYISEALIEDRLGCLQNEINLEYNRTIQGFIEFFVVRKRDYTRMVLGRKDLYFPIFEEYLKKYNLPAELKYLSVVESGLNPRIISRARAGGLWQFMPGTGREHHLYQDSYIDERFDPYKSTEAACQYLKRLYNLFGDWELALASYNCGPGNVRRAIRRSGNRTTFWEIYNYLPRETRSYVPQFVALAYVLNYSDDYKLKADTLLSHIPFDTIQVSQHTNLNALAKQLNTPIEVLQQLNPHIKKNIVPAHLKNYAVRIPADRSDYLAANRVAIMDSVSKTSPDEMRMLLASFAADESEVSYQKKKVYHTVRRGESLGRIADRYNVGVSQVKSWNRIHGNKVRSGQRLTIWMRKPVRGQKKPAQPEMVQTVVSRATVEQPAKIMTTEATSSEETSEVTRKKLVHVVKKGEALSRIADKYRVEMSQIREWNHLKGSQVRYGQRLTIWKEQPAKRVAESSSSVQDTVTQTDAVPAETLAQTQEATEADQYPTVVSSDEATTTEAREIQHTVAKGEGLIKIAKAYGVQMDQIKEWNGLTSSNVRVGQQLTIHTNQPDAGTETAKVSSSNETTPETVASRQAVASSSRSKMKEKLATKNPEKTTVSAEKEKNSPRYHRVQKGDTLWSISKQYGNIPVERLKKLNKLRGNELKAGQKLILG